MAKARKKAPRAKLKKIKAAKALLENSPAAIDEVRATLAAEVIAPAKGEDIPKGLVEISVKGTHLTLLGMQNQAAIPSMEQRLAIARRLNEVGPKLPRFVKEVITTKQQEQMNTITTSIGEQEMGKGKVAIPGTGLTVKDIEKAHAANAKEVAAEEKRKKQEAAKKAKEEEEKRKKESAARKKLKAMDVSPKVKPKVAEEKPAKGKKKDVDPKVHIRGISSPPIKKKAGMEPTKVPAGGFTKQNKPATSGELIRARIGEHKLTDDAIAAEVRKLWPGRSTAVSDVRWNRSQMEKAGVKNVPEPVEGSTIPGKRKK
jgi:hypothetical protein